MTLRIENIGSYDNKLKVLFDGDEIKYKCGFASQKTHWKAELSNGEIWEGNSKRTLNEYIKDHSLTILSISSTIESEPVQNALQSTRTYIESILNEVRSNHYQIYLSGGENYRKSIAKTREYKGNRNSLHKPVHFQAIHNYLLRMEAITTDGIEADDAIGIEHYQAFKEAKGNPLDCTTVVCSQDKDLKMIPGWNFNPNSNKITWISKEDANRWFWYQMLTGDTSDNIPGYDGIGPKKAEKIVNSVPVKDLKDLVTDMYIEYFNGSLVKTKDYMQEIGSLLWIQREPNQMWML